MIPGWCVTHRLCKLSWACKASFLFFVVTPSCFSYICRGSLSFSFCNDFFFLLWLHFAEVILSVHIHILASHAILNFGQRLGKMTHFQRYVLVGIFMTNAFKFLYSTVENLVKSIDLKMNEFVLFICNWSLLSFNQDISRLF